MLLGLSLENLIKGLLLSGPKQASYVKKGRISFKRRGHNLDWLLREADVPIDESTEFYLSGWSVSAEWFGKYPFPLEQNRVLDEYVPLESSEALNRRVLRGGRELTLKDLLHDGIGDEEWAAFRRLYEELEGRYAA